MFTILFQYNISSTGKKIHQYIWMDRIKQKIITINWCRCMYNMSTNNLEIQVLFI